MRSSAPIFLWSRGMGTHQHADDAWTADEDPRVEGMYEDEGLPEEDEGLEGDGLEDEGVEDQGLPEDDGGSEGEDSDEYYEEDPFAQVLMTADGENIPDVLKGIQMSIEGLTDVLEKQSRVLYKLLHKLASS